MHYYKRHIGDYIKDASHLTLLEHGAYVRLMDLYYSREAPLPTDKSELFRLVGVRAKGEGVAILSILKEFWKHTPQGWVQHRCDHEIEKARQKAEANRENGKHGGRPPKLAKESKPINNPDGLKNISTSVPVGIDSETEVKPYPTTSVSNYPTTQQSGATDCGDGKAPSIELGGTDPPRARPRVVVDDSTDPVAWRRIRAAYPAGTYEDHDFGNGEKFARMRVDEGFAWRELEAGVERLLAQKRAMGKIGSQYVWSPAKFFGPDPDAPGRFVFQREFKLPGQAEKPNAARDERLTREAAELQALVEGRAVRGLLDFREPHTHESANAYATALRLEEQDRRAKPAGDVSDLVAGLAAQKRVAT